MGVLSLCLLDLAATHLYFYAVICQHAFFILSACSSHRYGVNPGSWRISVSSLPSDAHQRRGPACEPPVASFQQHGAFALSFLHELELPADGSRRTRRAERDVEHLIADAVHWSRWVVAPTPPSVIYLPYCPPPSCTAMHGRRACPVPWHLLRGSRLSSKDQSPQKKQLRVGVARWLCSRHRLERAAWLGSYVWVLLASARCANLPPQRGRPANLDAESVPIMDGAHIAPVAGSDDAEGRRAASRRCGGVAQSCGRRRSFDPGISDPCARHQQGSCGPLYRTGGQAFVKKAK